MSFTADLKEAIVISIGGTVSTAGILKQGRVSPQTKTIEIVGIHVFKDSALAVPYNLGMFSKVYTSKVIRRVCIGYLISSMSGVFNFIKGIPRLRTYGGSLILGNNNILKKKKKKKNYLESYKLLTNRINREKNTYRFT